MSVVETRIAEGIELLRAFGMPDAQLNDRSALTLLALAAIGPLDDWSDAQQPLLGVTPIMEFCAAAYGRQYAPNSRETFRRQTLHQFDAAALVIANPDRPDRPTNSPKFCYQMTDETAGVVRTFGTRAFAQAIADFKANHATLRARNAQHREMVKVPAVLPDGKTLQLSPGAHSLLIRDIVQQFLPRFTPGGTVLCVGDTAGKNDFFDKANFTAIGADVKKAGKLPDVVIHDIKRDWLVLVESVTSHGPVDSKRKRELEALLSDARPGLVFVTAFPSRSYANAHMSTIAWETDVWLADNPTHLIHFNGDRFLGPRE